MTMTPEQLRDQIVNAPLFGGDSPEAEPGNEIGNRSVDPLNGAEVLDGLHRAITRYVVLPSDAATDTVVLWIAATHAQHAWEHATRLVIKSPLKRCGKTRLLEVISETVHRPLRTVNISTAALVRSIDEEDPPTLILDEGDTIFAKRRGEASEQAEAIRGILNSGHSRGWPYIRWDAAKREAEHCPTFAMATIAAIGDLPDTVEDRAAVIGMRRRAATERVAPFRRRRANSELHEVRDQLARWIGGVNLADSEPEMPVEDRAADTWESLIAIADAAGGDWPERARAACTALTSGAESDADEGVAGERLLEDLFHIFNPRNNDGEPLTPRERIRTPVLLDALKSIDEAPWDDWSAGKGLSARGLSRLLKPFRVKAAKWSGGARGYLHSDLSDAWARYRRVSAPAATRATDPEKRPIRIEDSTVADGVADGDLIPATADRPPLLADLDGVAAGADRADTRVATDQIAAPPEQVSDEEGEGVRWDL